jgi:hypothetical protein
VLAYDKEEGHHGREAAFEKSCDEGVLDLISGLI